MARILNMLPSVPLTLYLLLTGKKLRPFIAELTGLSQSHMRSGKHSELRETTKQRALESTKQWGMKQASKQGWSEEEVNSYMQTAPSSVVGEPRPYADFIHGLQILGEYKLPLTIAFAEEVDKLVIRLLDAHKIGDLNAFKEAIFECNWAGGVLGSNQQEAEQLAAELLAASGWSEVLSAVEIAFLNILFCFFAALDAEYGLIYFRRFQPRPLFLFVAPKMNSRLLNTPDKCPGRNNVRQPVRRLLELSHALMVWGRDQGWPDRPVGRKELGEALGLADQYIGNFFDGTRKINAQLFSEFWHQMCKTVAKCEPFLSPTPLALAAIFWQNTITRHPNQKLKSFILPDEVGYTRFWEWHHRRWASQLNNEKVNWPDWLDNQPS